MTCQNDLAQNLGLYALGALDAHEVVQLESHLDDCPACATELDEMRQVVSLLPHSVPEVQPPTLVGRRLKDRLAVNHGRRRSRPPHWGPLAVAATVALTVGIGATTAYWAGRAAQDEARISALSTQSRLDHQALAALAGGSGRDLALHGTPLSPAAHGAVRLDLASSQVALVLYGLRAPSGGRVYQGWLHLGAQRISVGTFVPEAGTGTVVLIASSVSSDLLTHVDGFGVTLEPAGGSSFPTTPPVVSA